MEWLFGRKTTPEEMMRKNQRALNKAMREMDRERMKLEQQEKKLVMDIKKMAKQNQLDAVKIMAKDLVRTRRAVKKFMLMKTNIQAVSMRIQTLRSTNTMAQAMKGVARAMGNMNKQMNLPQIQRIMQEFEKQSEIMDMKEEMMSDVIDDAMGEDDEEETDTVVKQVLDELGLQLNDQLTGLPAAQSAIGDTANNKIVSKQPVGPIGAPTGGGGGGGGAPVSGGGAADIDADLEARLEALRRQ